jgi:hypothetical protein|eukprot:COSAG02_NODE_9_length_59728_cov_36.104714_22_plen_75_part_00
MQQFMLLVLARRNVMAIAALMKTGGIPEAPRGIGRSRDPGGGAPTQSFATQQRSSAQHSSIVFDCHRHGDSAGF